MSVGQNSPPGVVFCERSFSERSQGPVFASNSAIAVTHLAQTARSDFKKVMRRGAYQQVATVGQPDGTTAVNGAAGSAKRQPQFIAGHKTDLPYQLR